MYYALQVNGTNFFCRYFIDSLYIRVIHIIANTLETIDLISCRKRCKGINDWQFYMEIELMTSFITSTYILSINNSCCLHQQ